MQCGNLPAAATARLLISTERGDEGVQIWPKMGTLMGLRITNAAVQMKLINSSRNRRFQENSEPITTNARGGAIREPRRTHVLTTGSSPWLQDPPASVQF